MNVSKLFDIGAGDITIKQLYVKDLIDNTSDYRWRNPMIVDGFDIGNLCESIRDVLRENERRVLDPFNTTLVVIGEADNNRFVINHRLQIHFNKSVGSIENELRSKLWPHIFLLGVYAVMLTTLASYL